MTIKVDLAQLKREKEAEWGRKIAWEEITKGAGISRNTLARLLSGKSDRVDNKTANGICRFFKLEAGPVPFITYEPDDLIATAPPEEKNS